MGFKYVIGPLARIAVISFWLHGQDIQKWYTVDKEQCNSLMTCG